MVFGVLSLVIVLAVVASLARQQTKVLGVGVADPRTAASAGARDESVAEQARSLEQKARDDVTEALKKGADRNEHADP